MTTVPTLRVAERNAMPELPGLPGEVRLALSEAAISAREGLLAMSVATGLKVMAAMMDAEITGLAGPKGKHDAGREAVRHGWAPSQPRSVNSTSADASGSAASSTSTTTPPDLRGRHSR